MFYQRRQSGAPTLEPSRRRLKETARRRLISHVHMVILVRFPGERLTSVAMKLAHEWLV